MAHIYRRGKRWAYSVHNANYLINGMKKKITKSGFRTKREAELAANKIELNLADETYFEEADITFEKFANEWLQYYGTRSKISSVRARRIAMKHLVDAWRNIPIKRISKRMYQSHIDELHERFSDNYLESIHSTGNMIFKHAKRQDILKDSPTEGFILPKKQKNIEDVDDQSKEVFLELNELETFLNTTYKHGLDMDYLMFTMLAFTGMRIGELLALKWSDISYKNMSIRIFKTYYNPNNNKRKFELLTTKNDSSNRIITIDERLIPLLKEHRKKQMKLKMKQKAVYNDQNFIFAENEGYPRVIRKAASRLERLMKLTDIEKHITPHSFRHTHASLLFEAGADIKEIQEKLGHASYDETMGTYTHLTKNIEEKTSHKFSQLTKGLI